MDHPSERLNKHLAFLLGISRREADELIAKGRVRVNDTVAIIGERVQPNAFLTIDGKPVDISTKKQLVLFNKPVGYVCSRKSQGDNPTIYNILPKSLHDLKTVGRLDKDSSGLILLTNDGDLSHRMTHPVFQKTKVYEVQLDKPLEPLHQQMISDYGVQLEDGTSKFVVMRREDSSTYEITMQEGRNRQIRRTFAALGYTVTHLHRTQFGSYKLNGLKPGSYLALDNPETI
mgnify:FL=1